MLDRLDAVLDLATLAGCERGTEPLPAIIRQASSAVTPADECVS